jgi:hypothetical protein
MFDNEQQHENDQKHQLEKHYSQQHEKEAGTCCGIFLQNTGLKKTCNFIL